MPLRILLIGLLTTLVAFDVAHATRDDEIRERKAVIILKDFRQSTSLRYLFSGRTGGGTRSSTSHSFQENYHAGISADILDPHIFNTSMNISVGLNQSLLYRGDQSSFGKHFRYSYQFRGTGLDKSATPFFVNSYRSTATVMAPYSPTYTTNSSGSELRAELRHVLLPATLKYSRTSIDNSGGGFDSSTVNNSYSFTMLHHYKDFSASGLGVTLSKSSGSFSGGPKVSSRAHSASLYNTLRWGEEDKYSLSSRAQVFESGNHNVQRNITLNESFYDRLGKALDLQVNYFLANSSNMGFESQLTETNLHSLDATLSHRLFDSLTSRVRAKASYQELLGGSESRYSSEGSLAYTKRIPGDNHLAIGASGAHEVVDSRFASSLLSKEDEYKGVHRNDLILLPLNGGILGPVVSVKSSSTFYPYELGRDYTLDPERGEIYIMMDGDIGEAPEGENLLISYTVSLDPVVKYASNSYSVNAGMTFLAGKYSLGGSYSEHWMSLIEGPVENTLRNSSSKRLYFSGNLNPLTYRINYTESLTGSLKSQLFEGTGQYSLDSRFGRFSLATTERYSRYGATSTTDASTDNTVTCSVSYLRNILSNARLNMSAHALDSRGEQRGTRDIISLRGSLQYTLNKMSLSFDGRSEWNFSSGSTTRDDTVTFDLLRYL